MKYFKNKKTGSVFIENEIEINNLVEISEDEYISEAGVKEEAKSPKIEAGSEDWQTRDGREVRIYATDGDNDFPVHGAINEEGVWDIEKWTSKGFYNLQKETYDNDLIPKPKKPLSFTEWFYEVHQFAFRNDSKLSTDQSINEYMEYVNNFNK